MDSIWEELLIKVSITLTIQFSNTLTMDATDNTIRTSLIKRIIPIETVKIKMMFRVRTTMSVYMVLLV